MLAIPRGATLELIIPVYNEEGILETQLAPVLSDLPEGASVTVVENGSTDATPELLDGLAARFPRLRTIRLPEPNYGLAMRRGLDEATGTFVITDDLDVLDRDFWQRGLEVLETGTVDIVQGSKVLAGRNDRRPLSRKTATLALTVCLRLMLGYRGTDTHGPKVMRLAGVRAILPACGMELDIFPTELVVRAQRAGLTVREIPIHLRELRATPFPLRKRVRRALRDLWRLRRALRSGN